MVYSTIDENSYSVDRHSNKRMKVTHYSPEVIIESYDREGKLVPLRALLDSGTSSTLMLAKYINKNSPKAYKSPVLTKWTTMGGTFYTKQKRQVQFRIPEFSTDKEITWTVHVDKHTDPTKAQYDIIIGNDLLTELGFVLDYEEKTLRWDNVTIPMKVHGYLCDRTNTLTVYEQSLMTEAVKSAEERHRTILDADYAAVDVIQYVQSIEYLSTDEKDLLVDILHKYPALFQGGLGTCTVRPIHLELEEGAKPYHARPYAVPHAYEGTTKREFDRLESIGVLKRDHNSPWAAATFIIPKKTGDVRVVTDFRKLNMVLKRKPFPLPKISDILQKLEGFTYATAIDLSMGYYHIPLDESTQELCTTVVPWGKYRYLRLPMGIKNSPDVFQNVMMEILGDLPFVRVYLDDVLITSSDSFQDHLAKISIVLERLENYGFRANLRKSFFAQSELDYLGYWITKEGIQPQPKKVEAIRRLTPPENKRQLKHFLGMVNYYRDMWRRRSHILAPLTALSSTKVPWRWGKEEQQSFDDLKRVISKETMLTFPNFNRPFHVYTDSSNNQLGAVIMQNEKPLAFYSRKLNQAQRKYPTGEQELLSIVETLKEFKNILLGQEIIVHTDHKNLLYESSSSDRIVRWRLLIEEYAPTFQHIAGSKNQVADALSRLNAENSPDITSNKPEKLEEAMTYLTSTEIEDYDFPLTGKLIYEKQRKDKFLREALRGSQRTQYGHKTVEKYKLRTYKDKVYIPATLQYRVVEWYHEYLCHPGEVRTEETIRRTMTWPSLRTDVRKYCKNCRKCQLCKRTRNKYGELPVKKDIDVTPWKRVDVDLIGPYTVKTKTGKHELRAITMIDPATRWFEIKAIKHPTSHECMEAFDNVWLSRYPRPQYIGYDNGSEFKDVFRKLCTNYGITPKPSSEYNPQANSTIERVHLTLGNMLRTFELEKQDLNEDDPWSSFLTSVAFAIRSTYHTVLEATPGQLVFGRDMVLPIQFKADWAAILQRKKEQTAKDNARENKNRTPHVYHTGDLVILTRPGILPKLSTPREGPYKILRVYTNGTVRIQRGIVSQRVNIRRITPYNFRTDLGGVCPVP